MTKTTKQTTAKIAPETQVRQMADHIEENNKTIKSLVEDKDGLQKEIRSLESKHDHAVQQARKEIEKNKDLLSKIEQAENSTRRLMNELVLERARSGALLQAIRAAAGHTPDIKTISDA